MNYTYTMLAVNFGMQRRMIKKELLRNSYLSAFTRNPTKMNARIFFKALFSLSFLLMLISCGSESSPSFYRNADFNADWMFHLGDPEGAADPGLNTSEWLSVHLPHDWSIIDYAVQDSLHEGPFYKNLPGGVDVGYLRNGTAWYRKNYVTPENSDGKQIILGFDGVQTQMELWVNDILIGEHAYGYT
ncbi:MAG: hypothetical protein KAI08_06385, partial [Bacteroidales bacterium]|nr:hypothetical protein [Bacteroidales bacterium]